MPTESELQLFDAIGVELEYMIVDQLSLNVLPISHHLLLNEDDYPVSEKEFGTIAWSNELTHHVIELKTNGPRPSLKGLAEEFQEHIQAINERLSEDDAHLLPTAMHPWMNPDTEMHLWPYDYSPVYQAFHSVFDCRGQGWANLQSMHINLPFCGDEEFARLHAAIRLLLPILPGLAASSPLMDSRHHGYLDQRLHVYSQNSRKLPSITGRVIPEPVYSYADYSAKILQPMYQEIAPFDPQGILQDEFLNSRGAIARFDRGAIEIRVIDVQESPQADIAIAALTVTVLRKLVSEEWTPLEDQKAWEVPPLRSIFDDAVRDADLSVITDREYLKQFGVTEPSMTLQDLWNGLFEKCQADLAQETPHAKRALKVILERGCLSRRILQRMGKTPAAEQLIEIYQQLSQCLQHGEMFGDD